MHLCPATPTGTLTMCVCVCNVRSGQSLVEDVVDKSTIAALPLAGEAPDFPCVPTDDTCGELMGK